MPQRLSERRLAENEVFFREHNERIEQGFEAIRKMAAEDNQEVPVQDNSIPLYFYCECSDEKCRSRIEMRQDDYNKIHEQRNQFIVLPGHEVAAVERIVQKEPACFIVQKRVAPPESASHLHATDINNT